MLDARASDPAHSKQQVPHLLFSLNRYEGVVGGGYGTNKFRISSGSRCVPRVGVRELVTLSRVIAGGNLVRDDVGGTSYTSRFETQLREKLAVKHALVVNSGTNALITALVG